ncbi:MAG: hypothetical protein NPIRA01_34630 [Nitrospirales bacterium]|nr:MAG: hypothetical protein NPIRA01_34630 [Nitrospirales bacterium]
MTWVGAVFSTLSSGLVLYLYSSGVNKKREKAIKLHFKLSKFLAEIRGDSSMVENDFWYRYKVLEHEVRTLGFQRDL